MAYVGKPGDLIFYSSNSWISRLIKYLTRAPGEEKTFAGHVAGMVTEEDLVEASFINVRKRKANIETEKKPVEIYRYIGPMPVENLDKIIAKALSYMGRVYGYSKILTHMADAILVKLLHREVEFFRKLTHRDKYPICSWVWAFAYNRGFNGYEFGLPPEFATPDDMHDFVRRSTDWVIVYFNTI